MPLAPSLSHHVRYHLRNQPEQALLQAGYLLSPAGFQMLQTLDFQPDGGQWLDARTRTIH